MGQRRVAAHFWTLALAAFLLVVAPASQVGSFHLAPIQLGDPADALEGLPFGEGMVLGTSRLSIGEFSREIERSRPLTAAAGLIALGVLLAAIACRIAPSKKPSSSNHTLARSRRVGTRSGLLLLSS